MAPHCQHEAVEAAHRGEDDEGDEARADGDQLLRSVFTVLSLMIMVFQILASFRLKSGREDKCYLGGGLWCGRLLYKWKDQVRSWPHAGGTPAQQPPRDLPPASSLLHHDDELCEEGEKDH